MSPGQSENSIRTRFQKGTSGNPKGRPPRDVRPISRRQLRRDAIMVIEEPVPVPINGKTVYLPLGVAVLRQELIRAARGEGKHTLQLLQMCHDMIAGHEDANPKVAGLLEVFEQEASREGAKLKPEYKRQMRQLRRASRNV